MRSPNGANRPSARASDCAAELTLAFLTDVLLNLDIRELAGPHLTTDFEGHYDVDGVSLAGRGILKVIVASDASY